MQSEQKPSGNIWMNTWLSLYARKDRNKTWFDATAPPPLLSLYTLYVEKIAVFVSLFPLCSVCQSVMSAMLAMLCPVSNALSAYTQDIVLDTAYYFVYGGFQVQSMCIGQGYVHD